MNGKSRGGVIDDYAHKVNVMTHWINITFPSRSGGNLNSELNCGGLKENGFVKYLFLVDNVFIFELLMLVFFFQ